MKTKNGAKRTRRTTEAFVLALCAVALLSAGCAENKKEDSAPLLAGLAIVAGNSGAAELLAQPDLDTARVVLSNQEFILTNKFTCTSGAAGIGFSMPAGAAPTLSVHNINLSTTTVSMGSGASVLDIDANGGTYGPVSNCQGQVIENGTTIYDLQVLACGLTSAYGSTPNPATATASFRVRCTKT